MTPAAASPIVASTEATTANQGVATCTPKRSVMPAQTTTWRTANSSATAAILPRNTPAGSMPDSRSPSRRALP